MIVDSALVSSPEQLLLDGEVRVVRYRVDGTEMTALTALEDARAADVTTALALVPPEATLFEAVPGDDGRAVLIFAQAL